MWLWWTVSKGYLFRHRVRIARMCFNNAWANGRSWPTEDDVLVVGEHIWRAYEVVTAVLFVKGEENV